MNKYRKMIIIIEIIDYYNSKQRNLNLFDGKIDYKINRTNKRIGNYN